MSATKKQRNSEVVTEAKSFTPRDYQVEILETAKQQNTIACLGTGTGKTFIAVLLIREYAKDVRIPFDDGGKRIFFLVPTVPLVTQQSRTIKEHTDLQVKGYSGDMNVDTWNKDQWRSEFVKNEVLVMTAEIFRIILDHAFIHPNRINLLIIDECHRAQGDHPYRQALRCFVDLEPSEMPRIFGLSASLLNGKCKPTQLEKNLRELEKTLRSTIVTASDLDDLQKYGTDPVEYVVFYNPYEVREKFLVNKIAELMQDMRTEKAKSINHTFFDEDVVFFDKPLRCLNSLIEIFCMLGPWCAHKAAGIFHKEVSTLLLKSKGGPFDELHRQILRDIENFLSHFLTECSKMDEMCNMVENCPNKIKKLVETFLAVKKSNRFSVEHESPPIKIKFDDDPSEYCKSIRQKKEKRNDSDVNFCSIIFVKQRITAYVLCEWLIEMKKKCPELDFLKPAFIVGHGIGFETGMPQKRQQKILKDFRERKNNVLVATCVLEEGMDIQQCNVVVRFDLPLDFRAYVQSKGRARARNSIYVMLVEYSQTYEKFIHDILNFKTIEKLLLKKCHERSMPDDDEIRIHMEDFEMAPYMPYGKNGPRITMTSAMSLINRYCASLPCDMATKLVPKWKIVEVDLDAEKKQYECLLQMPINSPLRKMIIGESMPQKKLAKMAAALKACKMLDELGELNENLVPVSCLVDKALAEELGSELEEEITDGALPGTNRRRQLYKKRVPIFMKDSRPLSNEPCFLHVIEMNLITPLSTLLNPRGRPLINPADTTRGLGILASKKIPPVNSFPIFTKSGKISVKITLCETEIYLSNDDFQKVEKFHQFIFSDVLWLAKDKLFSPSTAEMPLYIVPVNEGTNSNAEIDWNFMNLTFAHPYNTLKLKNPSTVRRTDFQEELFKNTVLLRSYKMNGCSSERPTFHHVVAVASDKSPLSICDATKNITFKEHYYQKYNIQIQNLNQPLLETVQQPNLHFWKPLYVSMKEIYEDTSVLSNTKKRRKLFREYLIPELCIIHPFPSPFFYKVLYLPTILFRLRSLLLAEELRQRVATEGFIGTVGFKNNCIWPYFNLETSDKELTKCLINKGEKVLEIPDTEFVPQDIIKENGKIVSFEVKVCINDHPGPSPALLLQALTSTSAGDEFDLERMEMIGDSFLKYVMSIKTYVKYPLFDEGKLTRLRSGLIQNLHLYQCAKKKSIGEYLSCSCFSCNSTWLPPCYVVQEYVDPKSAASASKYFTKHIVSDKCIADSTEALIGAYLLSCGQKGALMFMSWFGLKPLPNENGSNRSDFENWPPNPPNPILSDLPNVDVCLANLSSGFERFESIIKYKFKNKAFLLQAFTHPSYSHNDITDCYQRLEFLGDAVLDYLITRQLYEDPSGHSPGKLTDLRSALVNNIFFASLAVKYKYHDYLKMLSPTLFGLLNHFVELLQCSTAFKHFEEYGYYLEEIECFELEEVEVPKALGDVFESVAGAIYLDSGMSLDTVWNVYYPMIEPAMQYLCQYVPISPIRELYELVKQADIFGDAIVKEDKTYIEVTLPDGRKFPGVGPNKKVAKRSAAKRALCELKNERMDI